MANKEIKTHAREEKSNGAGEGTRTSDRLITNQLLYQLSYTGLWERTAPTGSGAIEVRMPRGRIELPTRGFSVHCSTN